jgi:DNA-binding transcriptional regulator YdaS (Cro superfamily)
MSLKIKIRASRVSQAAIADHEGISRVAVSRWVKRGVVPPARVKSVSELTGIAMADLNPLFAPFASSPSPQQEHGHAI